MARGGKRANAGRKRSAATKKTREIADKAATDGGLLPLEVMLANMRHYQLEAIAAEAKLAELGDGAILAGMEGKEAYDFLLAEVKKVMGLRQRADETADKCARFMHPILSPIDPAKRSEDVVPLAERLKAYQRKDAIETSAGKVVELKKKTGRAK